MTPEIISWFSQIKPLYNVCPTSILEIGSMNINGSPREAFPEVKDYVGVDQEAGLGVDLVCDAHDLNLERKFDCVISSDSLEHDSNPLLTIDVLRRHAAQWLIVVTPSQNWHIHRHPRDYWRILPDAIEDVIFKDFNILNFTTISYSWSIATSYCCLGQKINV